MKLPNIINELVRALGSASFVLQNRHNEGTRAYDQYADAALGDAGDAIKLAREHGYYGARKQQKFRKAGLLSNLGFSAMASASLVLQLNKDGTYEMLKNRAGAPGPLDCTLFVKSSSILLGTVTGRINVTRPKTRATKGFMEVGDAVLIRGLRLKVKRIVSPRHILLAKGGVAHYVFTTGLGSRVVWDVTNQGWSITGGGTLEEVRELKSNEPRRSDSVHPNSENVGYIVHPDEAS